MKPLEHTKSLLKSRQGIKGNNKVKLRPRALLPPVPKPGTLEFRCPTPSPPARGPASLRAIEPSSLPEQRGKLRSCERPGPGLPTPHWQPGASTLGCSDGRSFSYRLLSSSVENCTQRSLSNTTHPKPTAAGFSPWTERGSTTTNPEGSVVLRATNRIGRKAPPPASKMQYFHLERREIFTEALWLVERRSLRVTPSAFSDLWLVFSRRRTLTSTSSSGAHWWIRRSCRRAGAGAGVRTRAWWRYHGDEAWPAPPKLVSCQQARQL